MMEKRTSRKTRLKESTHQSSNENEEKESPQRPCVKKTDNPERDEQVSAQVSPVNLPVPGNNSDVVTGMPLCTDVSSPPGLTIHETPEKPMQMAVPECPSMEQSSTNTDGLALIPTPSATMPESPMKITSEIHNPDFIVKNVIHPTTPMKQGQPMQYAQPLVKIIEPLNPIQLQTFGSPQTEAIDYSFPGYGPRPMMPNAQVKPALRKLNKKSIKIEKKSQISVLPGTNSSYKTAGAHNRNKKGKIKRPMNAFMCFARHARSQLCESMPQLKNADVSVKLGQIWASMNAFQKKEFFDEAEQIKRRHREEFPDWVYQPGTDRKTDKIQLEQLRLQEQQQRDMLQAFPIPMPPPPRAQVQIPMQHPQQQQQQQHHHQQQQLNQFIQDEQMESLSNRKARKLHKNSYERKIQALQTTPGNDGTPVPVSAMQGGFPVIHQSPQQVILADQQMQQYPGVFPGPVTPQPRCYGPMGTSPAFSGGVPVGYPVPRPSPMGYGMMPPHQMPGYTSLRPRLPMNPVTSHATQGMYINTPHPSMTSCEVNQYITTQNNDVIQSAQPMMTSQQQPHEQTTEQQQAMSQCTASGDSQVEGPRAKTPLDLSCRSNDDAASSNDAVCGSEPSQQVLGDAQQVLGDAQQQPTDDAYLLTSEQNNNMAKKVSSGEKVQGATTFDEDDARRWLTAGDPPLVSAAGDVTMAREVMQLSGSGDAIDAHAPPYFIVPSTEVPETALEVQIETDPMSDKSLEKIRFYSAEEKRRKQGALQQHGDDDGGDVIVMSDADVSSEPQPHNSVTLVEDEDVCVPESENLLTLQNASAINVLPNENETETSGKSTQTSLGMQHMANMTSSCGTNAYTTTRPDGRTVTYHTPTQIGKQYITYNMDVLPPQQQARKTDIPVKRPRGRPRKVQPMSNTGGLQTMPVPTGQPLAATAVPNQYQPSPTSSNTSLPDNMQNLAHDTRQLYHAFNADAQGMPPWQLPFSQYPYDDCISRQAQMYDAQNRPYTGLSYNNDMYGMTQPYYRDDAGYWCEDYDQDIPARASVFCNNSQAYWPAPVSNVPELDMNRWINYMNDDRQSPMAPPPPSYGTYPVSYGNSYAPAPSQNQYYQQQQQQQVPSMMPSATVPFGPTPTQNGQQPHQEAGGVQQAQAAAQMKSPPQAPVVSNDVMTPSTSGTTAAAGDVTEQAKSIGNTGQTGSGEVTRQAGNSAGISAATSGKSAANLAEERIKQLIPMQQQSQNEAGGSVYTAATPQPVSIYANASTSASGGHYAGGATAQPQTQAADGMQQTTSPFRAFYPDACDVQRLNYNDCNTVTMYPRETTTHFASPVPRETTSHFTSPVPRETTTHFASPVPTSSQTQ